MSRVTCRSGIKGYQARLHQLYSDYGEWVLFSEIYNLTERLGFKNTREAWDKNPIIQGSVNPSDYRRVTAPQKSNS